MKYGNPDYINPKIFCEITVVIKDNIKQEKKLYHEKFQSGFHFLTWFIRVFFCIGT